MNSVRLAAGVLLFVASLASVAMAQAQRTFVSGLGSDSSPCSRTAPCRTFGQAISQTNAGGEVVALDSAGYGPFAITQAVSIIAPPGVYAGISVFSGNGIDINAGASDTVILRGLTVNNQGSNGNGIAFLSSGTLHVEKCLVNGFSSITNGGGISCKGGGNLKVTDSIFRGNFIGISIFGPSAVTVDNVRLEANVDTGLFAENGAQVTVRSSLASNNSKGFEAFRNSTSTAVELNIEGCVASNNANSGIVAESLTTGIVTVRVSNSTVTDNGTGLAIIGSAILLSRGNNTVEGNGTDTMGTIGSYSAK